MKSIIRWMDRDWAARRYNPVFAFAQRFVWGVPFMLSIALIGILEIIGLPSNGPISTIILVLGGVGMFVVMLVSMYRWAKGYGQTSFQERQANTHRDKVSERSASIRNWIWPNGN